jgi:hypothetical protein
MSKTATCAPAGDHSEIQRHSRRPIPARESAGRESAYRQNPEQPTNWDPERERMMGELRPEPQGSRRNRNLLRPRCDPPGRLSQGFPHRWPRACRMPRHGPRHDPRTAAGAPSVVAGRYRPGISSRTWEGQLPLHSRRGGETQTFPNIIRLEIRVLGENFSSRQSAGQHSQDGSNRYSYVPNTGYAAHLRGINRDAFEILHCCSPKYCRS